MTHRTLLAAVAAVAVSATSATAQDVIRIGTEGAYPPWNFTDASGELVGFEMDLARALCERMDATCEFVAQDWDGIIPALINGRYDAIMAGMSINDERRERISFSHGYATTPGYLVAPEGSPLLEVEPLQTVEDVQAVLGDIVVGVQVATIHQAFVSDVLEDIDVRLYDTQDLLNLDLMAGRVDAALADASAWQAFFATPEGEDFAYFGPPMNGEFHPVFGEGVGVGLRQADTELLARFNEAICGMQNDGSMTALAEEWFGFDSSLPCPE